MRRWPHATPRQQAAVRHDARRWAERFAAHPAPTPRYGGWYARFLADADAPALAALLAWYESPDPDRPLELEAPA